MKKIVLTGGGTAGHVTPNIALMPALKEAGYEITYIGSKKGMEKGLIEATGTKYYGISSGKLRRYFDWKNFSDPFRVMNGFFEAKRILRKIKPDVIFSKGGFVSVPVVLAAKALHIPAVIHESDMTPGLANRIALRGATTVCCNFPETVEKIQGNRAIWTGTPIRQELFSGDANRGLSFCGFDSANDKPVLLIIGGSQGSVFINNAVRGSLDELLKDFRIIHLCGKGNLDESLKNREGYAQYEFISKELPDLFAAAVKIHLVLDQILNARSFEKQGFSKVLEEESVTAALLTDTVRKVYADRDQYILAMEASPSGDSIAKIVNILNESI